MSEWRDIGTAPKDGTHLLLWGLLDPIPAQRELYSGLGRPTCVIGCWDAIDEAWAVHGGTWLGPFFKPTHYQTLPAPPAHEGE